MFATHGFHSVHCSKILSYLEIIQRYGTFVNNRYGPNAVVVFDGYLHGPSCKDHEHSRREGKASKVSPDVSF